MKILMALILMTSIAQAQQTYTAADVAKHATAKDCWMILNTTKVYNLTAFVPSHPGGTAIVPYCGKDGTAKFASVGHNSTAVGDQLPYLIGSIAGTPPPVGPIAVTVQPTSASLAVGATQQFTPTVSNSKQGASWNVAPATLGTITAAGLFKAATVGVGSVAAISNEDTTKFAIVMITVTPGAVPPPSTTASLPGASISDHFARHAQYVRTNGTKLCTSCHGVDLNGGTAVAHSTLVSPVYPGQKFGGPSACYLAPWGSPAFLHADPMATEVYPAQVCAPKTPGIAVFVAGTPITCKACHGDRIPGGSRGHGGGDD